MKEKDIENQILTWLNMNGVFCWKAQTVGIFDPTKRVYRKAHNKFHLNGISDILGCYQGKLLAIEVKTPATKNRLSEAQKLFLSNVEKNGGIAFHAWSFDDFMQKWSRLEAKCIGEASNGHRNIQ